MNMTNDLYIKTSVLSQILDKSIITIQIKHYNRSSIIMHM
jgi:hypothetical protein